MTRKLLPPPGTGPAVVPSVLSADMLEFGRQVAAVSRAGSRWVQVDVMDGRFVPNISFGPGLVKALHARFPQLLLDAHLMVERPQDCLKAFLDAGAGLVTVHAEAKADVAAVLRRIKKSGACAGLALNPATPVARASKYRGLFDLLLVMTVTPGFGGQKFLDGSLEKIAQARRLIEQQPRRKAWLQVDGGIDLATASGAAKAGADSLVAGNAVFGAGKPAASYSKLLKAVKEAARWQ
ncbi:MAG TPA: ribulose-phosphate 3-epimerase [Elusimicrobiales bacterium]|nr:ribulose-phosphate 3-epimerase [Elusimicrobiales bacterium]